MAKQAILLYNCSGPQWTKLHQMMMMLRFRIRVITPDRYHLSLEELAAGKGEAGDAQEAIPESMMVFCGVSQPQLEAILNAIHLAKLPPIPLKAVLTESNRTWNSLQLREELLKEREELEKQQSEV